MANGGFFATFGNAVKNYFCPPLQEFEEQDESWYDEMSDSFESPEEWAKFENGEQMSAAVFEKEIYIAENTLADGEVLLKETGIYTFIAQLTSISDPLHSVCEDAISDADAFEDEMTEEVFSEKTIKIDDNTFLLKAIAVKQNNEIKLSYSVSIN